MKNLCLILLAVLANAAVAVPVNFDNSQNNYKLHVNFSLESASANYSMKDFVVRANENFRIHENGNDTVTITIHNAWLEIYENDIPLSNGIKASKLDSEINSNPKQEILNPIEQIIWAYTPNHPVTHQVYGFTFYPNTANSSDAKKSPLARRDYRRATNAENFVFTNNMGVIEVNYVRT